MEVIVLYAIAAAGILLALVGINVIGYTARSPWSGPWIFRHLRSIFFRRRPTNSPITRIEVALHVIYWAGTLTFNFVGAKSVAEASARASSLTVFNMVPLLLSGRVSAVADAIHIPTRGSQRVHKTIGIMTVGQMGLHLTLEAAARRLRFDTPGILNGLSSICLALMAILGLPVPPGRSRPLFRFGHKTMAVVLLASLWWISPVRSPNQVFLVAAISMYLFAAIYHLSRTLRWSYSPRNGWATATSREENGVIVLNISLRRPMSVAAGQYIFVRFPTVAPFRAMLESHCLAIAWWDGQTKTTNSLSFLVDPGSRLGMKVHGCGPTANEVKVLVDGPYGMHEDCSRFASLLLLATGMGIAAQLSLLKEVLIERKQQVTMNGRIALVWQVESEAHEDWVHDWMDDDVFETAMNDESFQVLLYVTGGFKSSDSELGQSRDYGKRLKKYYESADFKKILQEELKRAVGSVLVTVSAPSHLRDDLREVCKQSEHPVDFRELEYQP